MSEKSDARSADLQAWLLIHAARDLAFYLQDRICGEHGITLEQYTVLVAIKHHDDPVTCTDVADWLGHKVNTVSMIADRMVKIGLLRRTRDLPDRRHVRLALTRKADEILRQATPDVWAFVQATMSSLSDGEKTTLIDLLERVRAAELQHFPPDQPIRIEASYETSDLSRLIDRLGQYAAPPAPVANRPDAVSQGPAALGLRTARAGSPMRKRQKGVSY